MPEAVAPSRRTLKLTLAYDGTAFVGWQRQASGTSIQGLLEDGLARIEGGPVTVIGAGRTDAGVHACGQVASAIVSLALDVNTLRRALNAVLPPDVRVLAVEERDDGFHARYWARAKTYRYLITTAAVVPPFEWRYCWQLPNRLDVDRMTDAAIAFEGEHDFAAFRATGSSVKTSRRTVVSSRLQRAGETPSALRAFSSIAAPADYLAFQVTATGFLRHMVRAMVGTLVEIGLGRREVRSIAHALRSGDRADAGPTAPACGLCLVHVDYGEAGPAALACDDASA
ncbi:MAG: tRNA pseudouridine(38-40) synthase TruA [Bacteroidales bacterium]